jgi:hypothetical protein
MKRSVVHLVLATVGWSVFYCAIAALGWGAGAPSAHGDVDTHGRRPAGCKQGRAVRRAPPAPRDLLHVNEQTLETVEYPTELGLATRAVFDYQSCRSGETLALDRIRELLDRNHHIVIASVERQQVRLVLRGGLTYVVHLNQAKPDCASLLAP